MLGRPCHGQSTASQWGVQSLVGWREVSGGQSGTATFFFVVSRQYHCNNDPHSSSYTVYVTLTISTNRANLETFQKSNALLENGCESNREVLSLHVDFLKTKISILQQCLHFVRHVFHIFLIIHLLSQTPSPHNRHQVTNQPQECKVCMFQLLHRCTFSAFQLFSTNAVATPSRWESYRVHTWETMECTEPCCSLVFKRYPPFYIRLFCLLQTQWHPHVPSPL